jgi:hypothetical protein
MMVRAGVLLSLTPVSALLDSSVMDAVFFTREIAYFDSVWNEDFFDYKMLSTVSFAAACDWSAGSMLNTLAESSGEYDETSCGETCKLLTNYFNGRLPQTFSLYSPSDHVTISTFWKYSSQCSTITVLGETIQDCSFDAGTYFSEDLAWIMSFRGTFTFDVINMRRNNMIALNLVSLCTQCAASVGPYANFVSLRFSIARALLKAASHIPAHQRPLLGIVGMSMGGQLAQFTSIFLSVERALISQNVYALITHGSPRVGNSEIARQIASGVDVPYINFIMYRDLVPHLPPMVFGFKHASSSMYWLYVMNSYYARTKLQGSPPDEYASMLRYRVLSGSNADHELASSLAFYDIGDHMKYFIGLEESLDMAACGGMGDKYFLNTAAVRLYDS